MDLISATDVVFAKTLVGSTVAYLLNSYIQKLRNQPREPLLPARDAIRTYKATSTALQATRSIAKTLKQLKRQCMVFYGSQTGTAERLAYQFSKEARVRFGLECIVADLNDYDCEDILDLSKEHALVFFLATYGKGEATDNAVAFDKYLKVLASGNITKKSTLRYAGFGLGSSSYFFYNKMIKRLDTALTRHGAQRAGDIGLGDDAKGSLERDYMVWKDNTLLQLASGFGLSERLNKYEPSFSAKIT